MYRDIQSGPLEEVGKKLADLVDARRNDYGGAIFRIVLIKKSGNYHPFWGKIELFYKDEMREVESRSDYGEIVLAEYVMSPNDVQTLLISISEGKSIKTPDNITLLLQEGSVELIMLGTMTNYGYLSHAWPCYFGELKFPKISFNLPRTPLVKRGLPSYPDFQTATRDFLGLEAKPEQYSSDLRLIIAVPDFRSRITGVSISDKKVSVNIDCKTIESKDLAAKVYMSSGKDSYQSDDMLFDNSNSMSCEAPFEPEELHIYLIDKQNRIMDARDINLKYSYYSSDTKLETPSLQVTEMVKRGEREDIEFKEKVGDDFLETFVSFANTEGGVILLGVDDHCKIVGTDEDPHKLKERLASRIARNVEPRNIKFELEKVPIDDEKSVIVIRIFVGEKKPYFLHDRGILVRRGSSDRWVTPSELDEIYSQRKDRTSNNFSI